MKRALLALVVIAATLATTAGQAAALTTVVVDGVKVALQTDGDLSITGTSGADWVELVSNTEDSSMTDVWVGETLAMTAVVNDVVISLVAGDDVAIVRANDAEVTVSEDGSSTNTPNEPNVVNIGGRLSVKTGGDNDFVAVLGVDAAASSSVALGASDAGPIDGRRDHDSAVLVQFNTTANLSLTGLANEQSLTTIGMSVGGQLSADLGQGPSNWNDIGSTYGRFSHNTGGGTDAFFSLSSDLGDGPSFRTAGGDDRLTFFSMTFSGKLVLNTGDGNDDASGLNGHFFANLGDGDDDLDVRGSATPNSVADGGPGVDSISGSGFVIKNFENA